MFTHLYGQTRSCDLNYALIGWCKFQCESGAKSAIEKMIGDL